MHIHVIQRAAPSRSMRKLPIVGQANLCAANPARYGAGCTKMKLPALNICVLPVAEVVLPPDNRNVPL